MYLWKCVGSVWKCACGSFTASHVTKTNTTTAQLRRALKISHFRFFSNHCPVDGWKPFLHDWKHFKVVSSGYSQECRGQLGGRANVYAESGPSGPRWWLPFVEWPKNSNCVFLDGDNLQWFGWAGPGVSLCSAVWLTKKVGLSVTHIKAEDKTLLGLTGFLQQQYLFWPQNLPRK